MEINKQFLFIYLISQQLGLEGRRLRRSSLIGWSVVTWTWCSLNSQSGAAERVEQRVSEHSAFSWWKLVEKQQRRCTDFHPTPTWRNRVVDVLPFSFWNFKKTTKQNRLFLFSTRAQRNRLYKTRHFLHNICARERNMKFIIGIGG